MSEAGGLQLAHGVGAALAAAAHDDDFAIAVELIDRTMLGLARETAALCGLKLREDGGTAALTPRLAASRARARKVAREAVPVNTCPSCFMAIPATGVCDNCG